ncbi:hypothetical protein BABINDRAFT_15489 [Babjeviella inositovora NRRL Y-12698]|uniref:Proteasome assembly chaperone 1 n=1 Tax=Babjeviella inositovora NRRL Y-12698 TaxID=984486 RepID=A0A1E3QII6_9ASCO|nr:uncharacterized protein BABINDRAFT_15489 [Babjeviella inositovora NRRL Y-12698]ODQ77511.1 hypothetical protein BABINDRAFT_15489 [Babjeviella inositovora NRRL Y-12698]
MLIKPSTELPTPRHIIQDRVIEERYEASPVLPIVTIDWANATFDTLLVAPSLIDIILTAIPEKARTVGTIHVTYPDTTAAAETEEYDEDEQLYRAVDLHSFHKPQSFDIHAFTCDGAEVVLVLVPYFQDTIVYNLVAEKVAAVLGSKSKVIALAPSWLNNNDSLSKLFTRDEAVFSSPLLPQVSHLKPPLFVTGPSAAVVAACPDTDLLCLALNAEGNSGFEKISPDVMIDCCMILGSLLRLDEAGAEKYMRTVSAGVRKSFSGTSSTSGMYL